LNVPTPPPPPTEPMLTFSQGLIVAGNLDSFNFVNQPTGGSDGGSLTVDVSVEKTVDPNTVNEGGVGNQQVIYTYIVTNSAEATQPMTVTSVLDNRLGELLEDFKAANGGSAMIARDHSVTFTKTVT